MLVFLANALLAACFLIVFSCTELGSLSIPFLLQSCMTCLYIFLSCLARLPLCFFSFVTSGGLFTVP
jgi:hypothetical protein